MVAMKSDALPEYFGGSRLRKTIRLSKGSGPLHSYFTFGRRPKAQPRGGPTRVVSLLCMTPTVTRETGPPVCSSLPNAPLHGPITS